MYPPVTGRGILSNGFLKQASLAAARLGRSDTVLKQQLHGLRWLSFWNAVFMIPPIIHLQWAAVAALGMCLAGIGRQLGSNSWQLRESQVVAEAAITALKDQ